MKTTYEEERTGRGLGELEEEIRERAKKRGRRSSGFCRHVV